MAARFWVGNAGTWDASDTTHWAASSGGAGGQTVPGASDTVTIDANSGTGTITVNHASLSIASLTCGAMGMTLDFSANNNNMTSASFSGTGTGTRTINLGNGTFTLTAAGGSNAWDFTTTTNLTFSANSSTISLTGATSKNFASGGLTYSTVSFAGAAGAQCTTTGAPTIATLSISAGNTVRFAGGATTTLSNAPTWTGTSSSGIIIEGSGSSVATIAISSGSPSIEWAALRGLTFTGTAGTATNSLAIGLVSGITVNAPTGGGGGGRVFGG